MVANREGRHLGTMMVVAMGCILTAAGTWGTPRPVGRPQAGSVTPRAARPVAHGLELILRRLKADFANPNSNYPHDVHGPNSVRAKDAKEWLSSLATDGHWADVEYEGPRPGWNAHLARLTQMAAAYAHSSSPDYHSPKMLEGVEHGLQYWLNKWQPAPHEWWQNTIGQPLVLARILVPLEDVLPADLMRECLNYFACPGEIDPRYATGQNLVWYAQQQLIRGALLRSGEDLAAASEALQCEIRITTGEGIQPDFSFHQHGPQLYNGGYGHDFMVDTAKYAAVLAGTRYAFTPEKVALLGHYLLEGSRESPAVHLTPTSPRGEQSITFQLPGRELAGKSQTRDVPYPLARAFSQPARRK
jgi:chondroitin AC lyase